MTVPLRDRLARRLYREYAARFCSVVVGWKNLYPEHRDYWREIAAALLASEEWRAREAVVEAASAFFPDGFAMRARDRIEIGLRFFDALADALARLDAVRGKSK